EDYARAMFARAFNREGGNIIGVIGDQKIEGAIHIKITNFWYASKSHLEVVFAFVDPDHRRSDHARTLIDFAKKCAKEIGIPLLASVVSRKRRGGEVRLYRKEIGDPAGAIFLFNASRSPEKPAKQRVRIRARIAPIEMPASQLVMPFRQGQTAHDHVDPGQQ